MSAIEAYKRYKLATAQSREWAQKLGRPYRGGGGGVGTVHEVDIGVTLHYQHSNGDQNYHKSACEFDNALATVITKHAPALFEEALGHMNEHLKMLAKRAVDEIAGIVKDAGIDMSTLTQEGKNAGDR